MKALLILLCVVCVFGGMRTDTLYVSGGTSLNRVTVDTVVSSGIRTDTLYVSGGTSLNRVTVGDVVSSGDIYSTGLTDISSSCVAVGWGTLTTKSIYYRKIGKQTTVYFDLKGTAHADFGTATIYFIPLVTSSTITKAYANCYAKDSSGVLTNAVAKVETYIGDSSPHIDFYIDYAQSREWPGSGAKEMYGSITFLAEE